MGERIADNRFRDVIAQPGQPMQPPLDQAALLGPGVRAPSPSLGDILAILMRQEAQRRMAQRKEKTP